MGRADLGNSFSDSRPIVMTLLFVAVIVTAALSGVEAEVSSIETFDKAIEVLLGGLVCIS